MALLAYLTLESGPQARDRLALLLWPEAKPERARARLRNTLWILGQALGAALHSDRSAVEALPAAMDIDVIRVRERLADTAGHGHPADAACPACVGPLGEIMELAGGPFMDGFGIAGSAEYDDWQQRTAAAVNAAVAGALTRLARLHQDQGELEPAIDALQRLVALDPLDERAHRELIALYASTGRRQAALRTYRSFSARLEAELGAAPQPEMRALLDGLVAGADRSRSSAAGPLLPPETRSVPLVGRERAWERLAEARHQAARSGRFVGLVGESGIGKTRLAETFVTASAGRGARTLTLRCYQGEAAWPYGPFVEAFEAAARTAEGATRLRHLPAASLRELGRLVELGDLDGEAADGTRGGPALAGDADAGSDPHARRRLFEATLQAVVALCAGEHPGTVLVDDLHWVDAPSLELLAYLVRRLPAHPLLLIATWREEEAPRGHPLRRLAAETVRLGVGTLIHLDRLDVGAVAKMVERTPGLPSSLAAPLHRESEGLPLLMVAYLAALSGRDAEAGDGAGAWSLPGDARSLLRARLEAVPPRALPLLDAAATLGRPADPAVLAEAAMLDPDDAVPAVEDLLAHGVLVEAEAGMLSFSHDKLRTVAEEDMSPARRRLVHRRVARALAGRGGGPSGDALAGEIARHLELAGDRRGAADWYARAGWHARTLSAHGAALAHLSTALALGHPARSELLEGVGDAQVSNGHYGDASRSYGDALALLAETDTAGRGRLGHKRAEVWTRLGDWDRAENAFAAALRDVSAERQPAVLAAWGRMLHRRGDSRRAGELAQRALAGAHASGSDLDAARAHNLLGLVSRALGEPAAAREHLLAGLRLASDEAELEVAGLNNLALLYGAEGDVTAALEYASSALERCQRLGDRPREAALHSNLADLLHRQGNHQGAMEHLKAAAAIYADVARDADTWLPEVWKLSEW